ncbi:urea carboxylase-associated family protein [Acidisoma cladoniae]|uniref:urea carboxylase-associated family protein n=1 Tax=Acidisoma cladoniae TaxID=3040935 RepID=UPI00254EAEEE|nr:urea carboxylase-associated family protein [Acidisoma sp. PAMC 29798]
MTEGEIPPGRATAIPIATGQRVQIINHLGQQVVDTWIFAAGDFLEYLSMEHCRDRLYKLFFAPGDELVSNLRRPLARIIADTSPGRHDTLCSACDARSYAEQGQGDHHPNCRDNLLSLLMTHGMTDGVVPCPWNLFMDIPVDGEGRLSDRPSSARPGDYIELEAQADIILVCSPCPQEQIPISGIGRPVRGLRWRIS